MSLDRIELGAPKKKDIANWIAVDWGTSNLRVWMMDGDGTPIAKASSSKGMGVLSSDEFEPALLALIDAYLSDAQVTPIICAGMVGAREGWKEAQYVTVPCAPPNCENAMYVEAQDPRISVRILPGVKQNVPPDVMRGEETQIARALRDNPDFEGVLCLPGTHTKWVHIGAGEIVSFQTYMTGEIFALLSEKSVLRHVVKSDDWDQSSFISAFSDAIARPQSVAAYLFGIRAGSLVREIPASIARARLSGLLIGVELAAARHYWLGKNVALIGSGPVSGLYRAGLAKQSVPAAIWDVTDLTLAGISAAFNSQKGDTI